MVVVEGLGNCEIIASDQYTITVVLEGESTVRYLDREDYPALSASCAYEKTVNDKIKDYALDVYKDEYVVVNIFDAFSIREISLVEKRTKMEDYLITFEALNGHAFIDDLTKEGTCTLLSRRKYDSSYNFSQIVAGIEEYYKEDV